LQAQKKRVGPTDPDEAPRQKRDPTAHERKRRNKNADSAKCGHDRNQPVAFERRVGGDTAEERKRCESCA
jgi:hypothetical protein